MSEAETETEMGQLFFLYEPEDSNSDHRLIVQMNGETFHNELEQKLRQNWESDRTDEAKLR